MVKVVDIAWIADKSLDIYCASLSKETIESFSNVKSKYRSKSVASSVGKIFSSVFNSAIAEYSKKFEKVFVIVPCFPIMRMKQASIISRFICMDDGFLSELGVSSNQFQEFFEKFIMQKCRNEYLTKDETFGNCFILNGRGVLLKDWTDAIVDVYGSSLVDLSKSGIFENNPGFINTMKHRPESFTETTEEMKFKLKELIKNLT